MTAVCPVCFAEQGAGLLCANCTDRLEHDLGDVAAIVAELDTTISRQARIGNGGKGGLARERMPLNVGAMGVADDLQNTLTTWAREVSDRGPAPTDDRQPTVVAAGMLLWSIDGIRKHPAVEELVDEITEAIRRARQTVDRPADRQYLGTCGGVHGDSIDTCDCCCHGRGAYPPPCDTPGGCGPHNDGVACTEEVYASPKAKFARCRVCGKEHDVAERRAALLDQSEDMLFSVKEAAQIIGSYGEMQISESTIRSYVSTGQLSYHGKVAGVSVIRLGDLQRVIAVQAAKPKGRKLRRAS